MITKISTLNMSREDWLEARRHTIGGSDASAIIGLNPYASAYSVWADKMGIIPEKEDNEAMRMGRDLEEYVAKRFTEQTGKKVRRDNHIITNSIYPFAHANIDRSIVGEDAGLECKTTKSMNIKKFKNGEFPEVYYTQCMHYMAVTGKKKWYLAVLVYGEGFFTYEIERDEDEIKSLMEMEKEFYHCIETKTEPVIDGSDATGNVLNTVYLGGLDDTISLEALSSTCKQLSEIKDKEKELSKQKKECENTIKSFMGDSDYAKYDKYSATWKSQTRSSFDWKALKEEHPEIDISNYFTTTNSRVFKFTTK